MMRTLIAAALAASCATGWAAEAQFKLKDAPGVQQVYTNCMSCHSVDHKVVGPAFKSVAAKYRGKNAEGQLVQKVMKGGSGVWGSVPMPPNAGLSQADAHTLVKWVLSH